MTKGWDHDPPAKAKLVPFGILMVASGALMLLFGSRETSDAWADALKLWWQQVRAGLGHVKRLITGLWPKPSIIQDLDSGENPRSFRICLNSNSAHEVPPA